MRLQKGRVTVVFAGGGTGGHIYPGLAVADALRAKCRQNGVTVRLCWIGNRAGMDKTIAEKNADADGRPSIDAFYGIPSGKLRRYLSLQNFFDLFKIFAGCIASFFILARLKPVALFSKGGFVSVPPCLAAKLLGIPVFTHECDFTPGLATRINSRFAERIFISYKETAKYFGAAAQSKMILSGNPVRPFFYSADAARGRQFLHLKTGKPILLVIGGSLGARQINELVREKLDWLCAHFAVVHQTGAKDAAALPCSASSSAAVAENYRPYPFIYSQMPDVIAAADVVLSRSGANALWECAVLGKPMLLIPLCGSGTRGDQMENAAFFERNGAAAVLAGENATAANLEQTLTRFLNPAERKKYADAAAALAGASKPAEKIADFLYKITCSETEVSE